MTESAPWEPNENFIMLQWMFMCSHKEAEEYIGTFYDKLNFIIEKVSNHDVVSVL